MGNNLHFVRVVLAWAIRVGGPVAGGSGSVMTGHVWPTLVGVLVWAVSLVAHPERITSWCQRAATVPGAVRDLIKSFRGGDEDD